MYRFFKKWRWVLLALKIYRSQKNRATLDQPCTDFSKSGGIQIVTASWKQPSPPLFEKSVRAWSNVARFFWLVIYFQHHQLSKPLFEKLFHKTLYLYVVIYDKYLEEIIEKYTHYTIAEVYDIIQENQTMFTTSFYKEMLLWKR